MEEKVLEIVSSITNIPISELSIEKTDVLDSLNKVETIIAIEDEFDVSFTQEEIAQANTIAEVISLLRGKV